MNQEYKTILDILKRSHIAVLETTLPKREGQVSDMTRTLTEYDRYDFLTTYQRPSESTITFAYMPPERLILLGGGHIAMPVCEFAAKTGFEVVVVDDRPKFANTRRFPDASNVICDSFSSAIHNLSITQNDYVAVITRGHKEDETCIKALQKGTWPAYVGLIGSKRRVKSLKEKLISEGASASLLEDIHTPIGLSIGAETPEEIAISILSELIQVKRGQTPSRKKTDCALSYDTIGFFEQICSLTTPYAIVTITSTKGSTPRKAGSIMVVDQLANTIGSIGGGCSESHVITEARHMIGSGTYKLMTIELTSDFEEEDGMVCGGTMEVLIIG